MVTTDLGAAVRQARAAPDALLAMVGPDPHRPGPARGRLLAEGVPVWALVGHTRALGGDAALAGTADEEAEARLVVQVAHDYDIPPRAVLAAWVYYRLHRGAVDALLDANAAVS